MKRIALLGPGTYTEESARHFLDSAVCEYVPCKLIDDVFMSTVNGITDYSVIPIENTFDGSVSLHLDWLVHEVNLPMQAEWIYPISIQLMAVGAPGDTLEASCSGLKKIVSHSVTLTQCRQFLRKYLPHVELEQVSSNGEAARLVQELGSPEVAALAPRSAGALYGLQIWAQDVQDHQKNFTRFVLVGQAPIELMDNYRSHKTTILVTLPEDYPGALHQVLSAFAWRRINLSKIESRPTKKKLGNYYFYIDIDASLDSVLLPSALQEIEAIGCQVRILGCYPTYSYKPTHSEV
ncbi:MULTISPECIES: prephenate dehydratase [Paenibacillus]|jgi:prephenate dehydratase|uniref:Prephenate dehydratase n=1 Tax=Paenibacillus baimaensis TaxID=2982185 RepID=A0ABT2UHM5_9BACL|nr:MULTISPECIES: prephenate dehydratase [unclassified Paenibacillus]MCU6793392.1 prephenate dehydratase [Paenibacillus sp. WQ 127069]OMF15704.1 prephenate dehydratase [Paenibacillus sp. FSL H7-0331]